MPSQRYLSIGPRSQAMLTIEAQESGISPRILSSIRAGEAVIINQENLPLAILLPGGLPKEPRPAGLCAGEFTVPDDFNEPLEIWDGLETGSDS